jgi:hypothetical protein
MKRSATAILSAEYIRDARASKPQQWVLYWILTLDGVRVVSTLNSREHWRTLAKRAKEHRWAVTWAWLHKESQHHVMVRLPAMVTITRFGKRPMDEDNLAAGCKAIRDQVAAELGVDDAEHHGHVSWQYKQTTGSHYRVVVEIVTQSQVSHRHPGEPEEPGPGV